MRIEVKATGTIKCREEVSYHGPIVFEAELKLGPMDLSKASFSKRPDLVIKEISGDSILVEQDGLVGHDTLIRLGESGTFMSNYEIARGPATFMHEMIVVVSLI